LFISNLTEAILGKSVAELDGHLSASDGIEITVLVFGAIFSGGTGGLSSQRIDTNVVGEEAGDSGGTTSMGNDESIVSESIDEFSTKGSVLVIVKIVLIEDGTTDLSIGSTITSEIAWQDFISVIKVVVELVGRVDSGIGTSLRVIGETDVGIDEGFGRGIPVAGNVFSGIDIDDTAVVDTIISDIGGILVENEEKGSVGSTSGVTGQNICEKSSGIGDQSDTSSSAGESFVGDSGSGEEVTEVKVFAKGNLVVTSANSTKEKSEISDSAVDVGVVLADIDAGVVPQISSFEDLAASKGKESEQNNKDRLEHLFRKFF